MWAEGTWLNKEHETVRNYKQEVVKLRIQFSPVWLMPVRETKRSSQRESDTQAGEHLSAYSQWLCWVTWAATQGHSDIQARAAAEVISRSMALPQPGSMWILARSESILPESGQHGLYHDTVISSVLAGGNFNSDLLSWSLQMYLFAEGAKP